ncbi:MAG: hypothetical protein PHN44_01190 [Candidatus Marinimicrobia bacterium]|nr:hypothetical protein [Candidatus Neomarinimicrobiota bacterium]MDD5539092.1 hypothetical protein [Candidatus Neomarinimicrobiota bacterium]
MEELKKCPKCGRMFIANCFYCTLDGTQLISVSDPLPAPEIVISWCDSCQVPLNDKKLTEDPETHTKKCPVCGKPLRVLFSSSGRKAGLEDMVQSIGDAVSKEFSKEKDYNTSLSSPASPEEALSDLAMDMAFTLFRPVIRAKLTRLMKDLI